MHSAHLYHLCYYHFKAGSLFTTFEGIQSLLVVLVFDLALIVLVNYALNLEDTLAAQKMAWVLFAFNLLYGDFVRDTYNLVDFNHSDYVIWFGPTLRDSTLMTKFCGKILFSGVFSYAIHYLTHMYVRIKKEKTAEQGISTQLADMRQVATIVEAQLQQTLAEAQQVEAEHHQIEALVLLQQNKNEQLQSIRQELATAHRAAKHHEAVYHLELIKRTLYTTKKGELCDSVKAMNAKMGNLTDDEKEKHREWQKEAEKKFQSSVISVQ